MSNESTTRSRVISRASEPVRKQRDGTAFTGAFGQRTGESDCCFVEGLLPERDGDVIADSDPATQVERCLERLDDVLVRQGRTSEDVLQLTLYLTDLDAYEQVNETYERYVDEPYPARSTVGVCDLLGGATVMIDAVIAIE